MIGYTSELEAARQKEAGSRRATAAVLRALDVVLSATLLLFVLPWFALRALAAWAARGRAFDWTRLAGRGGLPFRLLSFPGRSRGRSLPILWNVLRGEMSLTGPRPVTSREAATIPPSARRRFDARPGMVSPHAVRARTGVAYETEEEVDSEFLDRATPTASLALLARSVVVSALAGRRGATAPSEIGFFGLQVANTTMDEALDWIVDRAVRRQASRVAFVNPHCLNIAYGNEEYRTVLGSASRIFADGIGLRLGARVLGQAMSANVNGTDLFPRLCKRLQERQLSVFLFGARPGVALAAAANMQRQCPGLRIAGTRDGYYGPDEEAAVVEEINGSGADVLLVALGVPGQELWLARHEAELDVSVRIGVGGLFDFYSGRIPRAPQWMREVGLEWAWRLLREPRRMWRRYVVGNPVFLYRVWKQSLVESRSGPGKNRQPTSLAPQPASPASLPEDVREEILDRYDVRTAVLSLRSIRVRCKRSLWQAVVRGAYLSKRLLDIFVSAALLVPLSPVLLILAALIRLDSPGAVIFAQTRVGRWGRPFRLYKFRSMFVDAESSQTALAAENEMKGGVLFKMKRDPRITRVGRWLRKLSLDELPQLWNVLRGDMSLVGPRPPLPSEVSEYSPSDRRRLEAIPGITCIWQVSGRSDIAFEQQVELDVAYIESQSLWMDCWILLQTIPAVLSGRGAY